MHLQSPVACALGYFLRRNEMPLKKQYIYLLRSSYDSLEHNIGFFSSFEKAQKVREKSLKEGSFYYLSHEIVKIPLNEPF
jgi:hypothetical protein